MKSLVSVLMPALNEEHSIAAAMAGVLDQPGVDLELLVILAPSVDRTEDAVREMAAQDSRVRLLHNPRSIIPAALNLGLEAARGEFIARVDAHCRISPGYMAQGVAWMQRNPRLASVGGLRTGTAETATGPRHRPRAQQLGRRRRLDQPFRHRATTDRPCLLSAVTRTAAAREVGGWDEGLQVNEDVDFDHRLQKAGHQIGFDPAMRIEWRVRETVPDLFRQFRRYGRGKGQMIRKNGPSAVRLRHLVPPAFVTGAALLMAGGLVRRKLWLPLLPYLAVIGWASVRSWQQRVPGQQTSAAAIPASFMAIHSGWGLGMLEGSVLGKQPARASGNSAVREETPA